VKDVKLKKKRNAKSDNAKRREKEGRKRGKGWKERGTYNIGRKKKRSAKDI
jgi:hypothetical protein